MRENSSLGRRKKLGRLFMERGAGLEALFVDRGAGSGHTEARRGISGPQHNDSHSWVTKWECAENITLGE